MNQKQKKRLWTILAISVTLSLAMGLVLYALKQNINLFYTPTQLKQATLTPQHSVRIGGYVKKDSVHYNGAGDHVDFIVTDRVNELAVHFDGVLPNLFREGQTVVITGKVNPEGTLMANEVLAKHDEKYVPAGLAKELKQGDGYGT